MFQSYYLCSSIITSNQILFCAGLSQLRADNRATQSYYYAKASARNVLSHIRQWVCFCLYFQLVLIPARASDLVLFAQLMALSSGYDHIKAVIGSISFLHKNFNVNFPGDSFQLKTTLQSLKRKLAKAPNQALPISPSHLIAMYRLINLSNPQDLALWCSILVGFFGLLRKKSLCPDEDPSSLDPVQILTVRKVIVKRSEGIALLYINFSKTMQFGQKDLVIPLVSNNCKALDPIYHLDLLFTRTKAPPESPAFSYRTSSGNLAHITHRVFTSRLKNLLSRSGFSPEKFSGHSLRRGGATFLYQCGASALEIQACGDWASTVFTRYLFVSLEERLHSQKLMSRHLPS